MEILNCGGFIGKIQFRSIKIYRISSLLTEYFWLYRRGLARKQLLQSKLILLLYVRFKEVESNRKRRLWSGPKISRLISNQLTYRDTKDIVEFLFSSGTFLEGGGYSRIIWTPDYQKPPCQRPLEEVFKRYNKLNSSICRY